jgi:hypothetical protein
MESIPMPCHTENNNAISTCQLALKLPVWNCRRYRLASHTMRSSPTHTPPQENNPVQPLGRLNCPSQQSWKTQTANRNLIPTSEGQVERWTHHGEQGRGKEPISHCWTVRGMARNQALSTELSVMCHKAAKAESRGRQTSQWLRGATGTQKRLGEA